jgi:hypothetical protein
LLQSQNQDKDIITIEEIYNYIITSEVSNIKSLVSPPINYTSFSSENNQSISVLNSTIVKDVILDFKNEWEFLVFNNITITEINSDRILVSGSLTGKNIEKGMINYLEFQHTWLLENGAVINFID